MTKSVERSDVDITKLFKYEKEVKVEDIISGQSGMFYMRLAGDADLSRARVYGLRKSAELRKDLRIDGSDNREAFISELPEFKVKENLVQAILLLQIGQIQSEAINSIDVPTPKKPKAEADLEALEEYQTLVDNYESEYKKALEKGVKKIQRREERVHAKRSEEELYNIYEGLIIDRLCSQEMAEQYYGKCTYFGTYKDPKYKKRAFSSFDQFLNVATPLKTRLIAEYQDLEIGLDELKKSQEATD